MTILNPSVSQYSLTVDAAETIAVMVESADNPWGRRLEDALRFAMGGQCVYPVAPYAAVSHEDFRPDAPELPIVENPSVSGVLDKLQAAGYLTVHDVWRETSSEAYLSDGRIVTALHVARPFALVAVKYQFSAEADHLVVRRGFGHPDHWEITDRSHIVPAGWYLVGETGDYNMIDLSGVAGMDDARADWICWLADLEGFGATRCAAGCDACDRRWLAESGSWHFEADDCDAGSWDFDDAEDIHEPAGTVACPACAIGRVGFSIF
jgi:hypothetical protein